MMSKLTDESTPLPASSVLGEDLSKEQLRMTEHRYLATNGIRLHAVKDGPVDRPLVILLHGFPETWRCWERQLPFFASRGYYALAPDQRGYNVSDKPRGITSYNRDTLAADIVGLIQDSGHEQAYIVGHDWGGVVAWWLGIKYPQYVARLAILNAPHPTAMSRQLRTSMTQRLRSMYAAFFQLPGLPELVLRSENWRALTRGLVDTSRPGAFTAATLKHYREAWERPGAITAMLNWYRAAARLPTERLSSLRVIAPTLIIWGARDPFLGRTLATDSFPFCDDGKLIFLEDATHWLHHEEAPRVNQAIASFFSAG
jgi:epoxide hydrolase 4